MMMMMMMMIDDDVSFFFKKKSRLLGSDLFELEAAGTAAGRLWQTAT